MGCAKGRAAPAAGCPMSRIRKILDRRTARALQRPEPAPALTAPAYRLEEQVGFLLRRATQRHLALFAAEMGAEITPMRWAVLAKLYELGPTSQNRLGRAAAMDGATMKGVVDRLTALKLIQRRADPADGRRRMIALTERGRRRVERSLARARAVTAATLAPLAEKEARQLARLLGKLG
jgi:MarR family transcriptional regulator, lower aerobic nicotinate degradation pathway regulator